jgi:phosphomannomutase
VEDRAFAHQVEAARDRRAARRRDERPHLLQGPLVRLRRRALRRRAAARELESLPDSISTPELNIPLAREGENHALIADLQKSARFEGAKEIITIDGLRVEYPDGFGLMRASNTTPVIVLRFEADSDAALKRIREDFKRVLQTARPELSIPA